MSECVKNLICQTMSYVISYWNYLDFFTFIIRNVNSSQGIILHARCIIIFYSDNFYPNKPLVPLVPLWNSTAVLEKGNYNVRREQSKKFRSPRRSNNWHRDIRSLSFNKYYSVSRLWHRIKVADGDSRREGEGGRTRGRSFCSPIAIQLWQMLPSSALFART